MLPATEKNLKNKEPENKLVEEAAERLAEILIAQVKFEDYKRGSEILEETRQ